MKQDDIESAATVGAAQPVLPGSAPPEFALGVVVLVEGDTWVAGCLQLDIFEQGATIGEALQRLGKSIETHAMLDGVMGRRPFLTVPTTPERYWLLAHSRRSVDLGGEKDPRE